MKQLPPLTNLANALANSEKVNLFDKHILIIFMPYSNITPNPEHLKNVN